jgi:serine/threonine-protein kinase HipA
MTISDPTGSSPRPRSSKSRTAFVWVWLPSATAPVVAGRLEAVGDILMFNYGRSYLERSEAIPLYLPELPLQRGRIRPLPGLWVAGCLRDAGPDAWGQRVILARHTGRLTRDSDTADLDLITYLLESGSNRIGALDFQTSADVYTPRSGSASLEEMLTAAERLQAGKPLSPALDIALLHGTSIGGARPKVLLEDMSRHLIAKLSSVTDPYPVVKAEGVAMELARRVGLDVATSRVIQCLGRDVLLVDRFDRSALPGPRRLLVSALTMLEFDEMLGRYASYHALADLIRQRFTEPDQTLRELFSRIVFNIAIGNTDDHARNHAAFWNGSALTLTPAYDLCPQLRSGTEANQALAIGRNGQRQSRFSVCRESAEVYHLTTKEADSIIDEQIAVINEQWDDACDATGLTTQERRQLWHRQILNPFALRAD